MPDAIVIGSGPNGLVAATYLARAGWSVLVLETQPTPGGAVRSAETTLPGFVHDLGAAFFPFAPVSPAFAPLDLEGAGLVWKHGPLDSCHPAPDGSEASLARDPDARTRTLGADGPAWDELVRWYAGVESRLLDALLAPLPALGPALRLGPGAALRMATVALGTGRGFAERTFTSAAARRIVPGLSLHADIGPDDRGGALVGFLLALLASRSGFGVPEGGAGRITAALLTRLREAGGSVACRRRVRSVVVSGVRAVAVRTDDGDEIPARRAILADVGAPALFLKLLPPSLVPSPVLEAMRRFPYGFGTFKVDWALSGPVPWRSEQARRSAVVHVGDDLDDLARFVAEVRGGAIPHRPYLVVGQQSLQDPSRAPAGRHTLWAYSRVPSRVPSGWAAHSARFADTIDARLEELAPGFRSTILARTVWTPDGLEAIDENLVGGDLAGGTAAMTQQAFFRPVFPYFRYRTPVRGLYLASSYAHPGPGVHGACGRNAALAALRDEG